MGDESVRPARTVIDHHGDGSHTVRPSPGVSSAHADDKSMIGAVKRNLAAPVPKTDMQIEMKGPAKPKYATPDNNPMKPSKDTQTGLGIGGSTKAFGA